MKYHLIKEIVHRGDVTITKITTMENLADSFTKTLTVKVFKGHLEGMGLRDMTHLLYCKWEIVGIYALELHVICKWEYLIQ